MREQKPKEMEEGVAKSKGKENPVWERIFRNSESPKLTALINLGLPKRPEDPQFK